MAATVNGNWSYAVPLDDTNGYEQPQRTDTWRSQDSHHSGFREMRSASSRRTSDVNILSDSEAAGSRRASIRANNATANRKRSKNALKEKRVDKHEGRVDDSAWIHRDKLAEIEFQEMEEAGMTVRASRRSLSAGPDASARSSRSASQSGPRRPMSKDRRESAGEEHYGTAHSSYDDYERKRVSTIPAGNEDEEQDWDPTVDSEIRTPEEIAAEQQQQRQNIVRPSTSRIPISKASPVPVPQTVVDRDSPLPRSRNGSGAYSGTWDELQYARRARSGSIGSQVLLDDVDGTKTPPRPSSAHMQASDENSPPKARVPNKTTPTSGARKTSAPSSGIKRPPSSHGTNGRNGSNANKRPTSSSGHKSRPSTSHAAPIGDAPWIATMYKPDPRLPPDQQMLPTHAKRMMQEQWEKEGKTGTVYDRDFNLLNDEEYRKPKAPPLSLDQPHLDSQRTSTARLTPTNDTQAERNSQASDSANAWPLSPTTKSDTKSETGSVRPGTSGGYKITPTIATPPTIQRPPTSPQNHPVSSPKIPPPRVPDFDEKAQPEPKKGCCCIVM